MKVDSQELWYMKLDNMGQGHLCGASLGRGPEHPDTQ